MRSYSADLHVHSVLSPCGDWSMSPASILARARAVGLDLIAIMDHNMAENGAALRAAAAGSSVSVLYGMELETAEEVHVLCLFDSLSDALAWQEVVYRHLPEVANDPDRFSDQVVVDWEDNVVRTEMRLLANATDIPLLDAFAMVEARGGLPIPAHVDRRAHSLVSQLGFPPSELRLAAVELSPFAPERFMEQQAWQRPIPAVAFSDAHFIHEVGRRRTIFRVANPTVEEIRRALRAADGRSAWISDR
ncbi:MAG: PHP domain-containing protein [Armatimonadetes bacterium]|nr:PHP domain-containing protein [Armatimonadota bacterium]